MYVMAQIYRTYSVQTLQGSGKGMSGLRFSAIVLMFGDEAMTYLGNLAVSILALECALKVPINSSQFSLLTLSCPSPLALLPSCLGMRYVGDVYRGSPIGNLNNVKHIPGAA